MEDEKPQKEDKKKTLPACNPGEVIVRKVKNLSTNKKNQQTYNEATQIMWLFLFVIALMMTVFLIRADGQFFFFGSNKQAPRNSDTYSHQRVHAEDKKEKEDDLLWYNTRRNN